MNDWPEHEQLLSRLSEWLDETRAECEQLGELTEDDESLDPIGLLQLVEQMTALRHDVKLLTKASRSVEERNEATLLSMNAAIEQFQSVTPQEDEAAQKTARPLVEAIVDLDESLIRGRRVIENARRRLIDEWHSELQQARDRLEELYRTQPWWRRVILAPWHRAACDVYSARSLDAGRNIFDSLLEGYDLILNRLRRAMHEQAIVRMDWTGKLADPRLVNVVEVVTDLSREPGTVIEEIRPGYQRNGKVFRFAEVKAVAEH